MTRRLIRIPPSRGTALHAFAMLLAMGGIPGDARAGACPAFDHDHGSFTKLLSSYVKDGLVDYEGWKRDGRPALEAYQSSLAAVSPVCFASFTKEEQIAFLVNAYNASTVALVLENLPLTSIREIGLLPGAAFRRDFIALPALDPGEISLDEIEHEILRKRYQEPRIHFALVCAARSCPPLRSDAYRAEALSAQLDQQGRSFLGDGAKNRHDPATRTLRLSQIFEWFEEDFVAAAGSVRAFVAPYLREPASSAARDPAIRIEYLDYDWSLNGK